MQEARGESGLLLVATQIWAIGGPNRLALSAILQISFRRGSCVGAVRGWGEAVCAVLWLRFDEYALG